jgi:heat shock protein HslJ
MKNVVFLTLSFISIMIFSNCSNSKKTAGPHLGGSTPNTNSELLYQYQWKLTEVKGKMVPSATKAMLVFATGKEGKLSGSTGCNRLTGTFTLGSKDAIKFGPAATTRMACLDNGVAEVENAFIAALNEAESWSIDSEQLTLYNAGIAIAKFAARQPATKEQLQLNGTWELTYISGPKIAFEGLFPNKKPTIIFDFPEPQAHGNGGCNGYSAKVTVDGNKISFGDALSTMMACEGNGEPLYFKTLKTVTGYSIEGNTLLMKMGDVMVLKFVKK